MLIYEKNNKLNINFDNEISENPDVQIGKDGDKTEVLIDGSSNPAIPVPVLPEDVGKTIVVNEDGSYALANAGGGSEPFIVTITGTLNIGKPITYTIDKTLEEIISAINNRLNVLCYVVIEDNILVITDIKKCNSEVTFSHLGNINDKVGGGYGLKVEEFTITDEGVTYTTIVVDAHD